ncbi:unnamed protein product [Linum tenue]|uniref:Uncharacterized protein n=1 Tax=Linum tenue TaxID=586396 RepID=A0AAV0LIK4_9ROSI|nr:unnamed protein product [Linum tenue]
MLIENKLLTSPAPHPQFILAISILLLTLLPQCSSEIKNTHIVADRRSLILFEQFGFSSNGHVDISVKNVSWKSRNPNAKPPNLSNMGFFIARDVAAAARATAAAAAMDTTSSCILSRQFAHVIFRFDTLTANNSTFNASIANPGSYSLMFGNCQPEFEISMHVHTEMYNIEESSGEKVYLPVGQTLLPYLYLGFFSIYASFTLFWAFLCFCKQRSQYAVVVGKIHLIMAALLLVKSLKLICAAEDKLHVSTTGSPHGWDVAFYAFGFLKGIMLFTVIVLIGTGWSFLKPYLHEREKNVLMVVFPLQVLENIANVVIDETGPATKDWVAWNQIFLLMDILCCFAVLMPIMWSIKSLREASKNDGKAARNLEKLTLFRQFYLVLVVYLYFTRVAATAIGSVMGYRFEWVRYFLGEAASLVFYGFVFYNFQPVEKNPYFRVEEEEVGGQLLAKVESF